MPRRAGVTVTRDVALVAHVAPVGELTATALPPPVPKVGLPFAPSVAAAMSQVRAVASPPLAGPLVLGTQYRFVNATEPPLAVTVGPPVTGAPR